MYERQIFLFVCVCVRRKAVCRRKKSHGDEAEVLGQRYLNTGIGQEFVYISENCML